MKNFKLSGSIIITFLTRIEAIWALTLLLLNTFKDENKMEIIIQINSLSYWIFQLISAIAVFILAYIVLSKLQNNLERTNIFHWIYNYRFEIITDSEKENDAIEFFNKDEFLFIIEKIGRKYPKKSREDIVKLLEPHYSKFLDKNSDSYISLIDKPDTI